MDHSSKTNQSYAPRHHSTDPLAWRFIHNPDPTKFGEDAEWLHGLLSIGALLDKPPNVSLNLRRTTRLTDAESKDIVQRLAPLA